jgi:hypothetical protein
MNLKRENAEACDVVERALQGTWNRQRYACAVAAAVWERSAICRSCKDEDALTREVVSLTCEDGHYGYRRVAVQQASTPVLGLKARPRGCSGAVIPNPNSLPMVSVDSLGELGTKARPPSFVVGWVLIRRFS